MRLHYLQHASSEGIGAIGNWASTRQVAITGTHLYRGDPLPAMADFDFLAIMGGAMNIYQHRDHPWLVEEKRFIAAAMAEGKAVLGVCLGAQLIADGLGAKVYQNSELEIGWFPVSISEDARRSALCRSFPAHLTALHWHGDTFDLPAGAATIGQTVACKNQGFIFSDRVVGLQFHIEVRRDEAKSFSEGYVAPAGGFVQSLESIRDCDRYLPETHRALHSLLDAMAANIATPA